MITFTVQRIITTSIDEQNDLVFRMFGDMGHFIGFRKNLGTVFILFSILILSSQMIYYNNYRNGIKPTFLRVFQMMSGLVSPKSLGLREEQGVQILVKRTTILVM